MEQRAKGFTLIELMIVVTVMAILATLSVGGYRQYVIRANRTDAISLLLRVAAAQERWYLQNNQYAEDAAALGFDGNVSESGYYSVRIDTDNPVLSFTATAIPVPEERQSSDDRCQQFTINETGQRTSAPDDIDVCW